MNLITGSTIFEFLRDETKFKDPSSSSHWNYFHRDFEFNGSSFSGLAGFGGFAKSGILKNVYNFIFQLPFKLQLTRSFDIVNSAALKILQKQNRAYDLDVLRQVLTIAWLHDNPINIFSNAEPVVVIGDGFGTTASLLLATGFASQVILVNLDKTLIVDLAYIQKAFSLDWFQSNVLLLQSASFDLAETTSKVIAIQAKNHEALQHLNFHLAVNIASMQEMNPDVISSYFNDLRQACSRGSPREGVWFYCCNRESKILPDGTIVNFNDYPWHSNDVVVTDELCPWHQYYYTPRSLLPYKKYDGPIRHKLTLLAHD